jgi:hypothetical protein
MKGMVADDGFILINDRGQTEVTLDDDFEYQRFSLATFVGGNFPLLKAYFMGARVTKDEQEKTEATENRLSPLPLLPPVKWDEPFGGDAGGIHSRLLGRNVARETSLRFQACFGGRSMIGFTRFP